ncbi:MULTISPECIES: PPOX class F420-dependent oxidoreductase [Amycolatopsis]|uniref:PPOX class F420-dependent enzyme n=1 Tax=Amycolatopsis bullii TaxID=941987 RepID=A0ABQ3K7A7_9PSEU|nr:PPOX class F420-dependent oxidoreductase [Amycolatopsis bullii]GHG03210.1 PPOX class F420-dependent enzyme [Amycolatopsis bullii]
MPAGTADGPKLLPETEELATGKNFAAVTTVLPSGRLQTQMIWVDVEDGELVLNTETHRAKAHNVARDPRITVLIRDEANPYRYAEVRGKVTGVENGERARRQVDRLSRKYTGEDYPPDNIKSERVILRVTPERQTYIDQAKGIGD